MFKPEELKEIEKESGESQFNEGFTQTTDHYADEFRRKGKLK